MRKALDNQDERASCAPFVKSVSLFDEVVTGAKEFGNTEEERTWKIYDKLASSSEAFAQSFPTKQDFSQTLASELVDNSELIVSGRKATYTSEATKMIDSLTAYCKKLPKVSSLDPDELQTFAKAVKSLGQNFMQTSNSAGSLIVAVDKDAQEFHVDRESLCGNIKVSWLNVFKLGLFQDDGLLQDYLIKDIFHCAF